MILGRFICWATRKHKRGKLVETWVEPCEPPRTYLIFCCPRCGATWTRKVKVKKIGAPQKDRQRSGGYFPFPPA